MAWTESEETKNKLADRLLKLSEAIKELANLEREKQLEIAKKIKNALEKRESNDTSI